MPAIHPVITSQLAVTPLVQDPHAAFLAIYFLCEKAGIPISEITTLLSQGEASLRLARSHLRDSGSIHHEPAK